MLISALGCRSQSRAAHGQSQQDQGLGSHVCSRSRQFLLRYNNSLRRITVSHESPSSIGGTPLASPHRHLEAAPSLQLSKSNSKTGGVVEEPPVPAGSYLPRLTTAFNEMWIRESWHRFPLTRTILTTAMSLEASDQKYANYFCEISRTQVCYRPGQNVFLAVSRLAIAKGRLSALIRSVLEIELDSVR